MGRRLEKLQIIPLMIVTPLAFLSGTFYSISMLSPLWQKIALFNPVAIDDSAEGLPWHKIHYLRKQRLAHVHVQSPVH